MLIKSVRVCMPFVNMNKFRVLPCLMFFICLVVQAKGYNKILDKRDNDTIVDYTAFMKSSLILECEPHIVLSSVELNNTYLYSAGNSIRVYDGYRIINNSGSDIRMKAGFTIVLRPNTVVEKGNHYLARIEECVPSCTDGFLVDKFFTPNGDGVNDFWRIKNIENITDVEVYIYDRYGKFIALWYPNQLGWDGRLDGKPLPATDYWFLMTYKDCYGTEAELKSHFSLIR